MQLTKRISRWDPLDDLRKFENRLSSWWGNGGDTALATDESLLSADWQPAVDISEDEKEYLIKADLPDVPKDQVQVSVENGLVTITGERKSETEEKDEKKKYHRVERSFGRYMRQFQLPEGIEEDKVKAKFENGVLHLHIPKSEETKTNKKMIPIS